MHTSFLGSPASSTYLIVHHVIISHSSSRLLVDFFPPPFSLSYPQAFFSQVISSYHTMAPRVPDPAYPAKNSEALYGDKNLYAKLGEIAEKDGGKTLVEKFEIPIRSGEAWVVKKGRSFCC